MRVMITCGGTGGHITPGLAIADLIRANRPYSKILFVGATGGMEEELVTAAGYEIRTLPIRGFSRDLSLRNLQTLRMARQAVRMADELIAAFLPNIVIGTGGYACYPTLTAAANRQIPTAVHESNATPGLAVRWLSRRLDRVWLNFEAAEKKLPQSAKVLCVGNPVRVAGRGASPAPLPHGCRRMVLSFGGSLGAETLNRAAFEIMASLADHPDIFYLHASGRRSFAEMHEEFVVRGFERCPNLALVPFISDMPCRMAAADLVICRAGAISISELAALRRAAILIPSPNVTGNHQYKNAKVLADARAAVLLNESELGEGVVARRVMHLLQNGEEREMLSRNIAAFDRPDAARRIFEDLLQLSQKRK